ncbi:hypothetical protein ACJX0J_032923 [Zea mays]
MKKDMKRYQSLQEIPYFTYTARAMLGLFINGIDLWFFAHDNEVHLAHAVVHPLAEKLVRRICDMLVVVLVFVMAINGENMYVHLVLVLDIMINYILDYNICYINYYFINYVVYLPSLFFVDENKISRKKLDNTITLHHYKVYIA